MDIEFREMTRQDEEKAIEAAIVGMHFGEYLEDPRALKAYGRYFWYKECSDATQRIAAYADGKFAGVLLADIRGEKKKYRSLWRRLYVKIIGRIAEKYYPGRAAYENANREMLEEYKQKTAPDGEVIFLAAVPSAKGKGVGSALMEELARRAKGKTVYLFTDEGCTWQFYERKGFRRVGERAIRMDLEGNRIPLRCFLYSRAF